MRVGENDLESFGDLLLGGAAADIEEIRRLAASELDDVHGRHGKTRAIDHAADGAVELHIGKPEPLSLDLGRLLLIEIAQGFDVGMAEHARCRRSRSWHRGR